ncbi:Pentafunctional AROM polypeptide-like protein [Emericellopsis cladophorae]|uniref:Pentafunctional AROM polypeptide-like protein n=1 Tax=Emericellopsis cladophorae TaxID=2686198 RepID=A0A9P9Y090_9HYPO|nr:Pentafunctional AROM polypeptide-like protein [Emericellopsis cladophorae]KAI6780720.1 Pentafunctional AROM polypeptide-like protein [Emericellopsis cladophorae]
MAAVQQLLSSASPSPGPTSTSSMKHSTTMPVKMDVDHPSQGPLMNNAAFGAGVPQTGDSRIAVIVFGPGQDQIVSVFAEVLGKPYRLKNGFRDVSSEERGLVVGVEAPSAKLDIESRDQGLVVAINAHCVRLGMPPDVHLSKQCDFEFLYNDSPFVRRDLSRFIAFTLGQVSHHKELMEKPRTYFISTTFPDVRAALPNLDILTVGSDAVEIRVDLLRETLSDGSYSSVPSLSYVGEQVMLLRQRTELPLIFTTRCTNENGRFPMDDPDLFYEYLYRAIQWGVEYIDVELWLPEHIRQSLFEKRGNSKIMSAFHDFSGTFKWPSPYAQTVFERSIPYADIIKMIAIITEHNENFELEYFRSRMHSDYPNAPPLSAVNMGETGQFSRTLNKVFTPITHPLLPIIAAPGQMSTAEINSALALLGQLPRKNIYGISSTASRSATPQAPFYEKCFNELGLPHHFSIVERQPGSPAGIDAWCNQKHFGGAYLDPGFSYQSLLKRSPFFANMNNGNGPVLTEAARVIGIFDTIVVRSGSQSAANSTPTSAPASPRPKSADLMSRLGQSALPPNASLILDNASWKGIVSTLTRDLAPSAYAGRTAVVLAASSDDAAATLFAMKALRISKIYTVGFRTPTALARNAPPIEQFISLESLRRARSTTEDSAPFLIVSALGPEKSHLVGMLIRIFGGVGMSNGSNTRRVFLDLADGAVRKRSDPGAVAEKSGFAAYGAADVAAFTTVESLRLLIGQNVPYSFVRLASGRMF